MGALLAFQSEYYSQVCVNCGVQFAVPNGFDDQRRRDKKSFYCPNGHSQSYTESEADRLRKQLEAEQGKVVLERNRAEMAERGRAEAERATERLKRRVSAGVCPHCFRTVQQLARHIETKHPDCATHGTGSLTAADGKPSRVRRIRR